MVCAVTKGARGEREKGSMPDVPTSELTLAEYPTPDSRPSESCVREFDEPLLQILEGCHVLPAYPPR